LIIEKLASKKV